jgi:hypothetical protein
LTACSRFGEGRRTKAIDFLVPHEEFTRGAPVYCSLLRKVYIRREEREQKDAKK